MCFFAGNFVFANLFFIKINVFRTKKRNLPSFLLLFIYYYYLFIKKLNNAEGVKNGEHISENENIWCILKEKYNAYRVKCGHTSKYFCKSFSIKRVL